MQQLYSVINSIPGMTVQSIGSSKSSKPIVIISRDPSHVSLSSLNGNSNPQPEESVTLTIFLSGQKITKVQMSVNSSSSNSDINKRVKDLRSRIPQFISKESQKSFFQIIENLLMNISHYLWPRPPHIANSMPSTPVVSSSILVNSLSSSAIANSAILPPPAITGSIQPSLYNTGASSMGESQFTIASDNDTGTGSNLSSDMLQAQSSSMMMMMPDGDISTSSQGFRGNMMHSRISSLPSQLGFADTKPNSPVQRPMPFIATTNNIQVIAASMSSSLRHSLISYDEFIGKEEKINANRQSSLSSTSKDLPMRVLQHHQSSHSSEKQSVVSLSEATAEQDKYIPCPRPFGASFGGSSGLLCTVGNLGSIVSDMYKDRPLNYFEFKQKKLVMEEMDRMSQQGDGDMSNFKYHSTSPRETSSNLSSGGIQMNKRSRNSYHKDKGSIGESNGAIMKILDDLERYSSDVTGKRGLFNYNEVKWHDFTSDSHSVMNNVKSNNSSELSLSKTPELSRSSTPASISNGFDISDRNSNEISENDSSPSTSPFNQQSFPLGGSSFQNRNRKQQKKSFHTESRSQFLERDTGLSQIGFVGNVLLFQTPFPPQKESSQRIQLGKLGGRKGSSTIDHLISICQLNATLCHNKQRNDVASAWYIFGSLLGFIPAHSLNNVPDKRNYVRRSAMDVEGFPYIRDMLDSIFQYLKLEGDAQALAYLSCFIDDILEILKEEGLHYNLSAVFESSRLLERRAREGYRQIYCEILLRWNCKMERVEIQKYQTRSHQSKSRKSLMQQQQQPVNKTLFDGGADSFEISIRCSKCYLSYPGRPHNCANCAYVRFRCSICHTGVQGQILACSKCHHGGHPQHIHQWFKDARNMCPTGCGCKCIFQIN